MYVIYFPIFSLCSICLLFSPFYCHIFNIRYTYMLFIYNFMYNIPKNTTGINKYLYLNFASNLDFIFKNAIIEMHPLENV